MYLYAFDVDDTLEVSGGPVTLTQLRDLKEQGHVIGLCGNWAVFVQRVGDWHRLLSFLNAGDVPKDQFLRDLKRFIPADDFIMVGNILGVSGASDDSD